MSNPPSTWHVFKTANAEKAHAALEQAGIKSMYLYQTEEVFTRKPGANRTRCELVERAMMPKYAFASDPNEARLRHLVGNITHYRDERGLYRPAPYIIHLGRMVGQSVSEFDRLMAISGSKVEVPKEYELTAGDLAKVTEGPFASATPIRIEVVTKTKAKIIIGSIPTWVYKTHLRHVPESGMEKAA